MGLSGGVMAVRALSARVAVLRAEACGQGTSESRMLAEALSDLMAAQLDEGSVPMLKAAVSSAQEAVVIRRRLASSDDSTRHELARALVDLGVARFEAPDPSGAEVAALAGLAAVEEAVGLLRELAAGDGPRYRSSLAEALGEAARYSGAVGRQEASKAWRREALDLYRVLTSDSVHPHGPAFVQWSILEAGDAWSDADAGVALPLFQEAVDVARRLHRDDPDAYAWLLAYALIGIAPCLEANGRTREALEATAEAEDLAAPRDR